MDFELWNLDCVKAGLWILKLDCYNMDLGLLTMNSANAGLGGLDFATVYNTVLRLHSPWRSFISRYLSNEYFVITME